MISRRDVAKLVRESNSLIWPAVPTDVERVEAAVRWLRDELDDMKDRDAWRTAGAGIWPAVPTDVERVEAAVRWLRDELDDMKDRDAWRTAGAGSMAAPAGPARYDAR